MAPLVHTVVAGAFALAAPAKAFAPQRTIRSKTISMSSADERRMLRAMDRAGDGMWNPGANPGNQMGSGRGQFTFDSNSGIGGGMMAVRRHASNSSPPSLVQTLTPHHLTTITTPSPHRP